MAAYDNTKLFTSLKELQIIDDKTLSACLEESTSKKIPLDELILEKNLMTDESMGKIVGDLLATPYINLTEVSIPDLTLHIIPESVAIAQKTIAYAQNATELHIATTDPSNKQIQQFLEKKTDLKIIPHYTSKNDFAKVLSQYSKSVKTAFTDIIAKSVEEAQGSKEAEPPIIKIVDTILKYAYQNNASDVHIEPLEKYTLVRFRIDGILHDIVELPLDLASQIVTRVKVMANLRTDEHQEAQDGKLIYKTEKENLDIRVSIAAITRGEKIVMRLLSEKTRQFSLTDLGLSDKDLKKVEQAYHNAHGMVLATGPTGSGKTTTLYSILKLLNKREINIMTIEDPVEYDIDNVNQIQVNEKADITFVKGLRSIVRQDPDVILVGEIRDEETADIAINSAMTGHLVLSSLHTNDAVTSFPRLTDMKVEPYLVSSTVSVIVAQRLVRKICHKCKVSKEVETVKLDNQIKKYLSTKTKFLSYIGKGCAVCNNTGYSGRIGIFEVLEMNDEIRNAVVAKKSSADLQKLAVKAGMTTMLEDGMEKVKQGITTIEELLRVTKDS